MPKTLVGEGFATMATVHDASRQPAIAAGDKDNLVKVAKALREVPSYKKAPFTICADSDAWTGHPGEEKGIPFRPTLAFGPSMPGIVALMSAEILRESVLSTLVTFCV
jgi:hypothetical protein